ncbi:MAG: glycine-rich domain-containing protein [Candidatus Saccharimonadales bacterium]
MPFIEATGGTKTLIDLGGVSYWRHVFTSSDTFTVSEAQADDVIRLLLVGGGGSGGDGGGGGAGGLIDEDDISVAVTSYSIAIGAGGIFSRNNGSDSTAFGKTALGGGGGANVNNNGLNGGSGGGGGNQSGDVSTGGNALQPTSTDGGYGKAGGDGYPTNPYPGGGGGGSAAAGKNATSSGPGAGGNGRSISARFGTGIGESGRIAAGGGGSAYSNDDGWAAGGIGGGGDGGDTTSASEDGQVNTGSGGGSNSSEGGDGGSGIAVILYIANIAPDVPTTLQVTSQNIDTTPSFSCDVSDPNTGDDVKARFEVSTSAGSTVGTVDSAFVTTSGTVTAEYTTALDVGEYRVRVKAIDEHGEESAYTNYVDFSIISPAFVSGVGGFITKGIVPTKTQAQGRWSVNDVHGYKDNDQWPTA